MSNKKPNLLLVVLSLLGSGCSVVVDSPTGKSDHEPISATVRERALVVMGSSTAEGAGASDPGSSWVSRLSRLASDSCPDIRISNLAKGGYNSFQLLPSGLTPDSGRSAPDPNRNLDKVLSLKPDLVILQVYANDPGSNIPVSKTLRNHRILIDSFARHRIQVIEVGPFPRSLPSGKGIDMLALRDSIPTLVPASNVATVWDSLALDSTKVLPRYSAGDGVHLNDAGHAVIFRQVASTPEWTTFCEGARAR